MPRLIRAAFIVLLTMVPAVSSAQEAPVVEPLPEDPIGLFVVDVRGVMANFGRDAAVAAALGVEANTSLPGRGLGLSVGAHFYPLRRRRLALGLGADLLLRAKGSRTRAASTPTGADGPTVDTSLTAFTPQVSLNFGKRDGYSYVSGGIGTASYDVELAPATGSATDGTRRSAINYGGGARWFVSERVAFGFDLRFYSIKAREATATRIAMPASRLLVFGAGISVR
jgi:hypothetical protein